MTDHSESDHVPSLRFKFMPTPSAQLHIGHAWLLLIMDALAGQIRDHGGSCRIVLVIDNLMAAIQGLGGDTIASNTQSIINDIEQLGIPLSGVIFNDQCGLAAERCRREPDPLDLPGLLPPSLLPAYYFSVCSPSYFLANAVLDATLGITHILRGADQFHNLTPYRNFYSILGLPPPWLMYVPLLLDAQGGKIRSGSDVLIQHVLRLMPPEQLFSRLVHACVEHADDVSMPTRRHEAMALLFPEADECLVDPANTGKGMESRFLARLVAQPRIPPFD